MKSWLQIAVLVVAVATSASAQTGPPLCPDKCTCVYFHTIFCRRLGLTQPPPGNWPLVRYLYLSSNNISKLFKYSLTGFPAIVELELSGNVLTEFDLEILEATPILMSLDLENNHIHTVAPIGPGSSLSLDNLQSVFLVNNLISSLNPDLFASVAPRLWQLLLDENPLVVEDGEPFLNHPSLEYLFVSGATKLSGASGSFAGLPSLKHLIATESGITEVRGGAFPSGGALRYLYLNKNPLERFDVSAVASLADIRVIRVPDTPLACSCGYESLYWWALNRVSLGANCETAEEQCSFTHRVIH